MWPELNNGMLSDAYFGECKRGVQEAEKRNDLSILAIGDSDEKKKRTHFSRETLKNVHFVLFHLNIRSPLSAAPQLTNERVKCTIIFYKNMD